MRVSFEDTVLNHEHLYQINKEHCLIYNEHIHNLVSFCLTAPRNMMLCYIRATLIGKVYTIYPLYADNLE